MIINTNVTAMNTHRQMGINQDQQQSAMEKLSSGLRINKAGDDAAGLAISEKMRGQINGLDQASRNAQDGISMIQTAEGALDESHSILQRMRELSVQSANDTNVDADREELQNEVNQLASELDRIAENTEFNTQKLLDGSMEGTFQIGANEGQNLDVKIDDMGANALGVSGDGEGQATFELTGSGVANNNDDNLAGTGLAEGEQSLDVVELDNVSIQSGQTANYGLANEEGDIVATSQDGQDYDLLDDSYSSDNLTSALAVKAGNDQISFSEDVKSGQVSLEADADGSLSNVTASSASVDAEGLDSGNYTVESTVESDSDFWGDTDVDDSGSSVLSTINSVLVDSEGNAAAVSADGEDFYSVDDLDLETAIDTSGGSSDTFADDVVQNNADPAMTVQTSVTGGEEFSVASNGGIDISSQEKADSAISAIDSAIESVSSQRSEMGAVQNRLEHTISNLDNSSENLSAAESRIRDADMAAQMMEQTQASVKSQAAQSMLAQANQQPQSVLQLLG